MKEPQMTTTASGPPMTSDAIFPWRSLKTKVTIFTLAIFLVGMWTLAFYASFTLHNAMKHLLADQQYSTVSLLAADINDELDERLRTLEMTAAQITPAILGNAASLQTSLESKIAFKQLFNGGGVVTRLDGVGIAEIPRLGRIGKNHADRDYLIDALKGKTSVSKPFMARALKAPAFIISTPIRDTQGKVIGVIWGTTDLSKPSFLTKITDYSLYGTSGGYLLLVEPQQRLVVTSSDKGRIMETLPAPGINPALDPFIQGYEGSGVVVNPLGVEVLTSAKSIPAAGWYLRAALPTREAFAPVHAMQKRVLGATIFLTLLAGVLTWWMLKRQLAPVFTTMKVLAALSDTDQPPQLLPVTRQDEIGALIGGFNHLLETLGKREEALQKSEEKHRLLFDSAGDAIFIHREAEMLAVNQMACERLGYSRDELISMAPGAVDTPEQSQYVPDKIARLVEHGTITFETAHLRKDGSSVPTEVNARIIIWDGQPAIMSICRDITDRKRAEVSLARLNAQIQAKNKELEQVVYVASHDLRSPLVNIDGYGREVGYAIEELNKALAADHTSHEAFKAAALQPVQEMSAALRYIRSSTTQMDALLTGLLKLSRSGRASLTVEPLNMNELIAGVIAASDFQIKEAGATLHVGDLPSCRGDAVQVRQAFANLLSNALKYLDPKRLGVVRISGVCEKDRAVYTVEDNGIGIAPAHQDIIFEVFHRLDPTKSEGEGLGLTIVRQVVSRLAGEIRVESKPGVGSRFSVTLPVDNERR